MLSSSLHRGQNFGTLLSEVKDFCESQFVGAKNFELVGAWENLVFTFSSGVSHFVLRVTDCEHRKENEVNSELSFISCLRSTGMKTVPAVLNRCHQIQVNQTSYLLTVFPYIEGSIIRDPLQLSQPQLFEWGKHLSLLHQFSKQIQFSKNFTRASWDSEYAVYIGKLDEGEIIDDALQILEFCYKRINALSNNNDLYGLVHSDVHGQNMIWNSDGLNLIDFDDLTYHWYMYDLSVAYVWLSNGGTRNVDERFREVARGYNDGKNANSISIEIIDLLSRWRWCMEYLQLLCSLKTSYDIGIRFRLQKYHENLITGKWPNIGVGTMLPLDSFVNGEATYR